MNETMETTAQGPEITGKARIKVIGVGGAGNNAVNRMIEAGITSAEYIAVNTDAQILACSRAERKIQIGSKLTKGLGAGADPDIGRAAAEENKDELMHAIENTDLLFITAGMGGGTGTGAAPVIAKIAKDLKILTVAVVTEPFEFEGKRRLDNTMKGLDNLRKYVDTLIIIPNEKISEVVPRNASMTDALRVADEVLKQGIRGIADLIVTPSLINLDFADVRAILKDRGLAHMGVGVAKGENRIVEAVKLAVNSPLLDTTIEGATGVLLNVVGGNDLTFDEVRTAARLVRSVVDYSANIIFGSCIDPNISDEVEVTVIATGFPSSSRPEDPRQPAPEQRFEIPVAPRTEASSPFGAAMRQQPQQPAAGQQTSIHGARPQQPQQPAARGAGVQPQPYYGAQPQNGFAPQQPYGAQQPQNGFAPQQPYGAQQPQNGFAPQQPYGAQQPQNGYAPQQPYGAQQPQDTPAEDEDPASSGIPTFVRKLLGRKK